MNMSAIGNGSRCRIMWTAGQRQRKERSIPAKEEKDTKRLATFADDQIFLFILGALKNKTRIVIDFTIRKEGVISKSMFRGVNTDVSAEMIMKVAAKTKYQRNEIMEISNTIQSLLADLAYLRSSPPAFSSFPAAHKAVFAVSHP